MGIREKEEMEGESKEEVREGKRIEYQISDTERNFRGR